MATESPHPHLPEDTRLRVGFILARRFTLSPFALFVDTLRLASDERDRSGRLRCDWEVVAATPAPVLSSCGVEVTPTAAMVDAARFDCIVVVGGLLAEPEPVCERTLEFLDAAADAGALIVGLCTGTFILAGAGLLDGHTACVSWLHHAEFRERFPRVAVDSRRLFIWEDGRASCAGGASACDLAALIVRRYVGADAERNALDVLQVGRARDGGAVQPRDASGGDSSDARVEAAVALMRDHIGDRLTIADIAALLSMSRRQLERLFADSLGASPASVYARIRLDVARELVLSSRKPMIEIALDTGFETPGHFSRSFRHAFGQAPSAMRRGEVWQTTGKPAGPAG